MFILTGARRGIPVKKTKEHLAEELYECARLDTNIEKLLFRTENSTGKGVISNPVTAYRNRVIGAMCTIYTEAEMEVAIDFYLSDYGRTYQEKAQVFGEEVRNIITDLIKASR